MKDPEAHWEEFRRAAARELRIYPGLPLRWGPEAAWMDAPEGAEAFLDLA